MKTRYQCEKCFRSFATVSEALVCENQPEDPQPPLGLIYRYSSSPSMVILMVVKRCVRDGHSFYGSTWAAREGQTLTDNGDDENCEASLPLRPYNAVDAVAKQTPAFKRCIEWCQRRGFTPTVWDGTKACSL
jgi:hypothetical protein